MEHGLRGIPDPRSALSSVFHPCFLRGQDPSPLGQSAHRARKSNVSRTGESSSVGSLRRARMRGEEAFHAEIRRGAQSDAENTGDKRRRDRRGRGPNPASSASGSLCPLCVTRREIRSADRGWRLGRVRMAGTDRSGRDRTAGPDPTRLPSVRSVRLTFDSLARRADCPSGEGSWPRMKHG